MSYYSSLSIPNADCLYDLPHLQNIGFVSSICACVILVFECLTRLLLAFLNFEAARAVSSSEA